MKKIFTLAISFFLVMSAFAAINPSRLSVTSFNNRSLTIEVDGNRYERVPGTLVLDDLTAGYHNVKVYEVRLERRGFRKVDVLNLIYSSSLMLKPMYHINIDITPSGRIKISEEMMRRNGRGNGRNDDRDDWGRNYPGRNYPGRDNDDYRNNEGRGYNEPMSDRMFRSAKETVRNQSFDKDKAAMAKQIISNNVLNSMQVKEMMQVFSFDDAKLDFAKYAYSRTIDRNNFFIVYDVFSFRKNKEELMEFVQRSR